MHKTSRVKQKRRARKQGASRPDALIAAAQLPDGTISAVMELVPPGPDSDVLTKEELPILQGIAHGGEGYGSEYGSGPGAANADAAMDTAIAITGDSSSPAASAMTTRPKQAKQLR